MTLYTAWVCVDCYMHHHYPNKPVTASLPPMALLPDDVTAGLRREEHDCGWELDEDDPCWEDCECSETTFSKSSCMGCGSHLAGSRHAMTGGTTG